MGAQADVVGKLAAGALALAACSILMAEPADGPRTVFDPGANANVLEIMVEPDGRFLVGGVFSQIGGQPRSKIARLLADGTVDPDYNPSASTSGLDGFYSGAFLPDGGSVFGGRFSTVGGQSHAAIVRIAANGSVDPAFAGQVTGSTQTIEALARQPDGKLLVGGLFTTVGGQPRRNLARLNADGSLDTSFNVGTGADNRVNAIGLQSDGKIVIGGSYLTYNGQSQPRLTRLHPDGSLDTSFAPTQSSTVLSLLVQADDALLVGAGTMDFGGGMLRAGVARLLPDGSVDPAHVANVTGGAVYAMALQTDGKLVIGGELAAVDGVPRTRAARLNTDGSLDASFGNPGINGRVLVAAMQADGKVLLGGSFTQVGSYARSRIARLKSDGRIDIDAFTVTPLAGPNGTVAPSSPQSVNEGEVIAFTVTPDPNFEIDSVTGCNGTLNGLTYTTGAIVADCTVTANFTASTITYTVTPMAGANGALSPSTPQSVPLGQSTSFTVVPDAGYYRDEISGCGGSLSGGIYMTAPVLGDCSVVVSFHRPAAISATGIAAQQVTAVNTPFAVPLSVRVTDASDRAVAGVEVVFSVPASGASALLSANTAITDGNGRASVDAYANGIGGSYIVTASADGAQAAFNLANEAVDHGGVDLRVTVSTDPPPACGNSNSLDVVAGEQINYCFTFTNHTGVTLRYHTLSFAPLGTGYDPYDDHFFHLRELPIPPGGSYQYNHLINAGAAAQRPRFTWTAIAGSPAYALDANASVPFVDISGIGTALPMGAYQTYDLIDLPFPLYHYGRVFQADGIDRLCIRNSGTLQPHRGTCPIAMAFSVPPFAGDNQLFSGIGPRGFDGIAPYWDLLGDNGMVYYATVGAAPNRRLIVQWQQKDHSTRPNSGQGITFQASISEATGAIAFVYQDLTFNSVEPALDFGGSATVGLNDFTRAIRQQYSANNPVLVDGSALLWTPTDVAHVDSDEVRISVGSPRLELSPAAIEATANIGGTAQQSLGIGNSGNQTLRWSLDQAPSRAHFPPPGRRNLQPPTLRTGSGAAAPRALDAGANSAAFTVPAYAMKMEGTSSHGQPLYPVSFDAANPVQFVAHTSGAYSYGDNFGGDFVGEDFTRLFVFDGYFDSDFSLSALDLANGRYTQIGAPMPQDALSPPFPRWSGLGFDRSNGTLYASTTAGVWCQIAPASELYTIDAATGAATRVAAIDAGVPVCVADIAIAPNGAMYGIDAHNDTLLAIDKVTGEAAVIGSLGIDLAYSNSLDFDDSTGVLYLAAYQNHAPVLTGGMFTVNPVTGMASWISQFPTLPDAGAYLSINGLAIARAGGHCAEPGEVPWLTTNRNEGQTVTGEESIVGLALSAEHLAAGRHEALLCVHSNDLTQPLLALPIGFTVTDTLFAHGFETDTP